MQLAEDISTVNTTLIKLLMSEISGVPPALIHVVVSAGRSDVATHFSLPIHSPLPPPSPAPCTP